MKKHTFKSLIVLVVLSVLFAACAAPVAPPAASQSGRACGGSSPTGSSGRNDFPHCHVPSQ